MYSMPPSEACSTALKEKKQSKTAKENFFLKFCNRNEE